MNDFPTDTNSTPGAPAVLFTLAGLVFFVSLFCPVIQIMDDSLYGWGAAYITAWGSVAGLWQLVTHRDAMSVFEIVPMMVGTAANFALLTTACFGWKLHRRHAIPMLVLSINGLLAAMLMPAMMEVHRTGVSLEVYGELKVGYWLWIVTFALTAVGWWSVVRKQRSQRVAG